MTVNDFPWRIAAIKVKFYTIRTSYFGLVSGVSFTLRFVNNIRYKLSMDIHRKPIAHRIEWLMQHARQYSQSFSSSAATIERQRYLAEHPSAIAALKCMDGRINLSVDTHTPAGIIQPFRNLGGMFDLGWPHLGEVLANYVHTVVSRGQRVLLLITYHYSKGDKHRGCAGFNYDTQAARASTYTILRSFFCLAALADKELLAEFKPVLFEKRE